MRITVTATREDHLVARFAALAIAIHIVEAALPSPLPGVKPGLANVITLIVLLRYGWRMAVWVGLLRVLVGSLLIGSFMTPTFMLSASGAIISLLALGLFHRVGQRWPGGGAGAVGLSVIAAMAHMGAQFVVAWTLFVPHPGLINILPVLMTMALLFGVVSGWIAAAVLARMPPKKACGPGIPQP